MRFLGLISAAVAVLLLLPTARAADAPKLELKDGDRIVYLGNTFAERDANYGYLETLLTIRHPDISFTFRNLGWSGDTVWGDARARFGTRADGFKHLKEHVLALKPTIILVAYGMNESFAGEAGLKEFESGLNTLLDTLAETKAKIVLISPIPHEKLPPPLPDPAATNTRLELYDRVIATVAESRKLAFVDLFARIRRDIEMMRQRLSGRTFFTPTLTDDGIHLTERGYHLIDWLIAIDLGIEQFRTYNAEIRLGLDGKVQGENITNSERTDRGYRFEFCKKELTRSGPPTEPSGERSRGNFLRATGLPKGTYEVRIDGAPFGTLTTTGDRQLIPILRGPDEVQVEKLRAAINKKNELYFHRWRPQNETYLFGFRKHEQGNNSVEIPQFDPLVAEQEAEIARLKKPVKHTYELIREEAGK